MLMTGSLGKGDIGLKGRIARLLEAIGRNSLTMGEIIDRLDLDKTQASDVSSALYKLRSQGQIECIEGEASSNMGRRVVKRYRWVIRFEAMPGEVRKAAYDPRHILGREL